MESLWINSIGVSVFFTLILILMQGKRAWWVWGWWQLVIRLQRGNLQHALPGGGVRGRVRGPGQHASLHELRPHRDGGDGLLHGSEANKAREFVKVFCYTEKCPDCGRIPPGRRKKPKERFKRFRKLSVRKNGQKLREALKTNKTIC